MKVLSFTSCDVTGRGLRSLAQVMATNGSFRHSTFKFAPGPVPNDNNNSDSNYDNNDDDPLIAAVSRIIITHFGIKWIMGKIEYINIDTKNEYGI